MLIIGSLRKIISRYVNIAWAKRAVKADSVDSALGRFYRLLEKRETEKFHRDDEATIFKENRLSTGQETVSLN